MRTPTLLLAAVLLTSAGSADEVFLKGGGQLSGKIVSRTATTIEVDPRANAALDDARFRMPDGPR